MAEDSTDTAAQILDDVARHVRLDTGDMHGAIAGFPDHMREAIRLVNRVDWSRMKPTTPAGICCCGMGGSAISGDLARSYWENLSPVPFLVVRNYELPTFINEHWAIIASSYSGNTEETLSAIADAVRRRCRRVVALASGGKLRELARKRQWPLIELPSGLMPRASLGYTFAATMLTLARWGVAGNNPAQTADDMRNALDKAADFLAKCSARFDRECPARENPAKAAAAALAGQITVVLGSSGSSGAVALRFKSQLNENGKMLALASVLPEANHNEIVGFDSLRDGARQVAVIVLSTGDESREVKAQQQACARRLGRSGVRVLHLRAEGADRLQRLLYLVHLGDFISYHTAIINGEDPSPITAIEELKESLSSHP